MPYKYDHYADHIDYVELTPPASRTLEKLESRRLSLVMSLMAILLCLCVMASSHVSTIFVALLGYHALAIQSLSFW